LTEISIFEKKWILQKNEFFLPNFGFLSKIPILDQNVDLFDQNFNFYQKLDV